MQKFKTLFSVTLLVAALSGCGAVEDAQVVADKFYEAMKIGDTDSALKLFDDKMFETFGEEKVKELLVQHNTLFPGIKSYTKYAFSTKTKNGITGTILHFELETANGKVFERLEFVKRDDGFKLSGYYFSANKSEVETETE